MSFFIAFLRYYYYNINVYLSKRGQNMIEFKNVYKTYSTGTEAVNNANFKIEKGEFAFFVLLLHLDFLLILLSLR